MTADVEQLQAVLDLLYKQQAELALRLRSSTKALEAIRSLLAIRTGVSSKLSLPEACIRVLELEDRPVKAKQITDKLTALGYTAKSRAAVNQALYRLAKLGTLTLVERGVYTIKRQQEPTE